MNYDRMVVAESSLDGAGNSCIIGEERVPSAPPPPEGTSEMNAENLRDGWVRVYRSVLNHHVFEQSPAEYFKIWVYMLLRVNHRPRTWWDGRTEITIPPGCLVASLNRIASDCNVSKKQAERAIEKFKQCQMIVCKPGHSYTMYELVNFGGYNPTQGETGTPKGSQRDTEGTPGGQQGDTEGTPRGTNKKERSKEEKKKETLARDWNGWDPESGFQAFLAAYPPHRRNGSRLAQNYYLEATGGTEERHLKLMALLDRCKASEQWAKDSGQYITGIAKFLQEPPWHILDAPVDPPVRYKSLEELEKEAWG